MPRTPTDHHQPTPRKSSSAVKTTAPPHSLCDDVITALRTLGVAIPREVLDAALTAAEKESLGHLAFLHRLLADPAAARRQRAIERRIRQAKFREVTSLDGFDWEFNAKGVDRVRVEHRPNTQTSP